MSRNSPCNICEYVRIQKNVRHKNCRIPRRGEQAPSPPTKKSQFERQKAEAEAKRLREEAETKAVYEDFIKSFDDEEDGSTHYGVWEG